MVLRAAIFDLDGVLVDTAKYHYLAWRALAHDLGFDFPAKANEHLKGVSRMRSLEILLEVGNLSGRFSAAEMATLAARKNDSYVALIQGIPASEILPGAIECLEGFRKAGVRTALGSASLNAGLIIARLGLQTLFDAIVDGRRTTRAKPDPEVFLLGARDLGVMPADCVVFEDAQAGLDAARAGGMRTVAIGSAVNLSGYDIIVNGLHEVVPAALIEHFAGLPVMNQGR